MDAVWTFLTALPTLVAIAIALGAMFTVAYFDGKQDR